MSATINMLILGADQLASQYSLTFPGGIPGGGDAEAIALRLDQSLAPPERMVETYDIFYRGVKKPMTSMTDATDKSFTVDVRIDQNWKVINDLEKWLFMCYDFSNGTALNDNDVRTTGLTQYYDGVGSTIKQYKIEGLKIKGLKIGDSENSSPDPLRATISFIWNDWYPV